MNNMGKMKQASSYRLFMLKGASEKNSTESQFQWMFPGTKGSSKNRDRRQNKAVLHNDDWCRFGVDPQIVADHAKRLPQPATVFERRTRWTSPLCKFGSFESCAHAREVQIP